MEAVLSNKPPKWNYVDGCMMKAVLEMYYITNDNKYLDFADRFMDFYVGADGGIFGYNPDDYNCDNINGGKALISLYNITGKQKYKLAAESLYNQLKSHPRTSEGSFWHKKAYPYQVWLDGLYMVQPFYTEYEMNFNKGDSRDTVKQFDNVQRLMKDSKTGLFYHGYDESRASSWADKSTGLSPNFWTRSLGWYAMALVDTLEKSEYVRQPLQTYLNEFAGALLKASDESQMFYQVTVCAGRPGNYLETSGTCAIAYTLMKGARLGYLPGFYFDRGSRIFDAAVNNKFIISDNEFVLKDICLSAGLGAAPGEVNYRFRDGSYEYYISEPVTENDGKGVAPFMLAYAEKIRHKGNLL